MDRVRPLATLAVVAVLGTGVGAGVLLTQSPDPVAAPPAPAAQPPQPPQPPPVELPSPGVLAPPAVPVAPPPPAPASRPAPAAPNPPTQQRVADERRQAARDRLREEAIRLCEKWGFSHERCQTAPR